MDATIEKSRILEILRNKCRKIIAGRESALVSAILILSSNNGCVLGYARKEAFETFSNHYGENALTETLQKLEHEAIVKVTPSIIGFANLDSFSPEMKDLSRAIGVQVFNERKRDIFALLNRLFAAPEGKLVVEMLFKQGQPYLLTQLESVVGKDYLNDVMEELLTHEVLFKHRYTSRKYDYYYYKFLPGVDSLLERALKAELDQSTLDALSFIYISQKVREEGVLQSDCQVLEDQIPVLSIHGLISENHWYLSQFRTTDEGSKMSRQILQKRTEDARGELQKLLQEFPAPFLAFVVQKYLSKRRAQPEQIMPVLGYYSCSALGSYDCIMGRPELLSLRNNFFERLVKLGFATLVHDYVSTRGGEIRGNCYCIPDELLETLQGFLRETGSALSDEEEKMHRMYHLLIQLKQIVHIEDEDEYSQQIERLTEQWGVSKEELKSALQSLQSDGFVDTSGPRIRIMAPEGLETQIKHQLLDPIVQRLLGQEGKSRQELFKPRLPRVVFEKSIFPGQKATADETLEEWLHKMKGEVIGELDFVDKSTFAYLDMIPRGCGLKLIVGHIKDPEKCIDLARRQAQGRPYFVIMKIEYPGLQARVSQTIHERWLASKEIDIDIGADLKSDALGKSKHTIRVIEVTESSEHDREFKTSWEADSLELERIFGVGTHRERFFEPVLS
jgi:hypothetical protein